MEQWWPVPKDDEYIPNFLKRTRDGTMPYLVMLDNKPIGYIQTYILDYNKHPWLPPLPTNTLGIDQFIGEPDYLHKGLGTLFIKAFIDYLTQRQDITCVILDPEPANLAAIRCYEKVGFKKVGEFQATFGPALLMRYDITPKS